MHWRIAGLISIQHNARNASPLSTFSRNSRSQRKIVCKQVCKYPVLFLAKNGTWINATITKIVASWQIFLPKIQNVGLKILHCKETRPTVQN